LLLLDLLELHAANKASAPRTATAFNPILRACMSAP
jgi:hypothetical protein